MTFHCEALIQKDLAAEDFHDQWCMPESGHIKPNGYYMDEQMGFSLSELKDVEGPFELVLRYFCNPFPGEKRNRIIHEITINFSDYLKYEARSKGLLITRTPAHAVKGLPEIPEGRSGGADHRGTSTPIILAERTNEGETFSLDRIMQLCASCAERSPGGVLHAGAGKLR